jgi:hypothetical protein
MTTLSRLACRPCLLSNLIALGTFATIGLAVKGAWVMSGLAGAAVVAGVLVRRRTRFAAMGCSSNIA